MIGLDALKKARRLAHDVIGHPPRHSLESRIHINNIWSRRVEIGSSHDDAFGRRIEYRCWVDPASIGSHVSSPGCLAHDELARITAKVSGQTLCVDQSAMAE
jgi:hypothetical protein